MFWALPAENKGMKPFSGIAALALLSLLFFGGGMFLHGTPPAAAPAKIAAPTHHGKKPAAKADAHKAGAAQAAPVAENPLAFPLMAAGGLGLLLAALAALGLSRAAAPAARRLLEAAAAERRKQQDEFEARNAALRAQLQDAKARKAETEALREQVSRQFQEFFRTLPVPCFCFAANGRIIRWNAACETLYGIPAAAALERTLWETIIPDAEREEAEAKIQRVLAGESLHHAERRDTIAGGTPACLRCNMVPLYDAEGCIIGGLSAGVEVPELTQYEQQIAALSAASEAAPPPPAAPTGAPLREQLALLGQAELSAHMLTQLVSSAAQMGSAPSEASSPAAPELSEDAVFQARLAEEIERSARYHGPLSLILVGLDNFAARQALGLEESEKTLQRTVTVIKSKLRTVDVICRLGADAYALILPETGEAGARVAAERLRTGLAAGGGATPQTACFGAVQLSPDISGADMLISRASAALAQARACGPNTVTHYQDMPPQQAPEKAARKRSAPKKTVSAA